MPDLQQSYPAVAQTPDLQRMNKAQREAVTWGEGPLLLLAGPGSGKTFTIANRILFLIEQGVPPEELLVITFTKEAALSMQRRFQKMSDKFYPVNFGTFHSVFYHILQESGGFRSVKLLKDSQKRNLIIPILKKYDRRPEGAGTQESLAGDAGKALEAIGYYKNTGDEGAAEKMPDFCRDRFSEILREYREAVQGQGALDFDDMLFECKKLLESREEVRSYWQGRFRHILIDEFQDINPVQYQVLRLLAAVPRNIFAVGDDDQSVYGFRGSRPELMKQFTEEYRAETRLLDVNYRCAKSIIDASLAVIGENRNRFLKNLKAAPGRQEGELSLRSFRDREEESAYLTEALKKWLEEHREDREYCAVLFRTNAAMQGTAARLKKAGIPCVMSQKVQSIYEHFIVKDIMAYLLLAAGEWKREYLLRIINKPSRYVGREAVGEGRSLEDMKKYYERKNRENGGNRTAGYGKDIPERLEQLQRQMKFLKGLSPGAGVSYILKAMKYEAYLKTQAAGNPEKAEEWEELLDWLKADGAGYENPKKWLEAQEAYTSGLEKQPAPFTGEERERVRLMTVHGAKGLEFHTVFLPDCNERVFPHGSMPGPQETEEERRLFYVAMTRAKESLELLYLSGDRTRPRLPSRFLNPLLYSSSSISSSNSQLSRYSSKASATLSYSSSSAM